MSQMNYRYPGLKPFEVKEATLFFGRAQETRDFYNLVVVERLVVLFAKSGMGKTSLLNAGLIPMLGKSDLLPVYVRFNNTTHTLHEQFLQKMEIEGVVFDPKYRGKTLWEQLKYAQASKNGRPATPLIIFDQFEEIFTLYPPEQRLHFIRDFADVANRKIPETVQTELLRLVQENPEVSDSTLAELERHPSVQCIFSIRSDLLHLLNALSPQIPDILRSRYELGPLSEKGAREAIVLPAALPAEATKERAAFSSPPFRYDEACLAEIISALSRQGQENIESFQLQIICQAIEKIVIQNAPNQPAVISTDLYGGASGIQRLLTDFYTDKISELPEDQRLSARRIVEEELITETERRRSVDEGDLLKRNATAQLLNQLVEMRLLRKEPRLDSYYYEISHDTLVPPILVKYRERRREEERLAEIERLREEQAKRDAQLAEERRKRTRALRYTLFASVLAAVSVAAMIYAIWQRNIAERDKRQAFANDMAYRSQIALRDGDRTYSFSLAWYAQQFDEENENPQVVRALTDAFYYNDHPDSTHRLPWHYDLDEYTGENEITSVAFSPDGKKLITGDSRSSILIWNNENGEFAQKPLNLKKGDAGHNATIRSIAFSPDGKWLATGSEDNTAKIWDLENQKVLMTLKGHPESILSVAFSPDGKQLATASEDNTAKIWDLNTGEAAMVLNGHSESVMAVAFSLDGKWLATGSSDATAILWDATNGKAIKTLKGHGDVVRSVAFSPDAQWLATGSDDQTAKIWNVNTGKMMQTLAGHNNFVTSVAFSPDGKRLATGSEDNTALIWELETGKIALKLVGHRKEVWSVAFSPDGKKLATGSADAMTKIWDLDSGEEAIMLKSHRGPVSSVAFSPDGKKCATGSCDSTVNIWDTGSGKVLMCLTGHSDTILSVAFSPNGQLLATGSDDRTAKIWNLATGKETMTLQGHSDLVTSVAFSPDGKKLATGSADSTIRIWDVQSGIIATTLQTGGASAKSLAFSPDGKRLAGGYDDHTTKIWDLKSGNIIRTLTSDPASSSVTAGTEDHKWVTSVAFSPDGSKLATGSDDCTANVWDLTKADMLMPLMTLRGHSDYRVLGVAFSPDGKKLATSSEDWTAKIWNLGTQEAEATLEGHSAVVNSVAFSPDGKRLITGSADATAKIWEVQAQSIDNRLREKRHLDRIFRPHIEAWSRGSVRQENGQIKPVRQ